MFLRAAGSAKSATLGVTNPSIWRSLLRRTPLHPVVTGCYASARSSSPHLPVVGEQDAQIMTGQQVAELLQVPPRTLEEWRQTRTGPPWRRVGKHVRYLRAEVFAWFEGLDSHA